MFDWIKNLFQSIFGGKPEVPEAPKPEPKIEDVSPIKLPPEIEKEGDALKLKETLYYLAIESDYPQSDRLGVFKEPNGKVIYTGSSAFKKAADIEGSCKLNDGRVLNYASHKGSEVSWKEISSPYGHGVKGYALQPMRSAAVDPHVVPYGSKLFIKETVGLSLLDGSKHDGIWFAHDTGGAIKGARIDLFAGVGKASMKQFYAKGLGSKNGVTVEILKDDAQAPTSKPVEPKPEASKDQAPWMKFAVAELGTKEISGSKHNQRIIDYHNDTSLSANDDETAWCSSFVNWCFDEVGIKGTRSAWARKWLDWGVKLDKPRYGCVCVIERNGPGGDSHVFFWLGEQEGTVLALGGNQGNSVSKAKYSKSLVLGYRWPSDSEMAKLPKGA